MKFRIFILLGLFLMLFACNTTEPEPGVQDKPITLETSMEKSSYALGLDIGNNISQGEMAVEVDALLTGLRHGLEGHPP